jgi:putative peptidoglycan lipid II flippase
MQASDSVNSSKSSILKSAAAMSMGTFLSRILGMVRDMVIAAYFTLTVKDAFVVAFRLPNLFRRLLGEGSLAASFIPIFVEYLALNKGMDPENPNTVNRARELANAVFTLLLIITGVLTALGLIFMRPIMELLVSGDGYQSVEGKLEITVQLARIMFGFVFLVTLYAFLMSILNVYKKFFVPAVAPAIFNLVCIIFSVLPPFEFVGDQLAWGVLAGGVAQLLIVVYPLVKMKEMPSLTWHLGSRGVRVFFKNLLPSILGMSVLQLMTLFNTNFASRLPEGSHSYIYFADRLLEFPLSLLSVSLGVALLPTLSELFARGEKQKMIELSQKQIRFLLFLSLPCTVGFFLLAEPIVKVIYGYGAFSANDVQQTADVLRIYSFLLIFTGVHRITVPNFYAIKNTWLPAVTSVLSLAIHLFVADWAVEHYGLQGLVGSTTFAGLLNLLMLLAAYKYYFGAIGYGSIFKSVIHLVPSLAVMGAAAFYLNLYALVVTGSHLLALVLAIGLAVVLFFGVNLLVRHPDSQGIMAILKRRLKKT